jgi:hypothetical protein
MRAQTRVINGIGGISGIGKTQGCRGDAVLGVSPAWLDAAPAA